MKLRNPKRKGIEFERRVKKDLEAQGCFVVRQASSAFPDLICVDRKGRVQAIECKVSGYLSRSEKAGMANLAHWGFTLWVATINHNNGSIEYILLEPASLQ